MMSTHQPDLFPELDPYLPREIPRALEACARAKVGFQLNYQNLWTKYRVRASLKPTKNLRRNFADYCSRRLQEAVERKVID